jgi:hypothetical protein
VELDAGRAQLTWPVGERCRRAEIRLPVELGWSRYRGEEHPIRGWYSPGFGRRVPGTSLIGIGNGSTGTNLVTTVHLPGPEEWWTR